jgi:hypothetical protein
MLEDEQQYARDQIALRQQQEQMRQFPYAQRSHPPIHRSDSAQLQQQQLQQQQETLPQRDTMSDMQEQFSKLAESTFLISLPSSVLLGEYVFVLHRLWLCSGVRLAARTVLTVMFLLLSCSRQTHVQLLRLESESQSSRFRSTEVRRMFIYPLRARSFTYTSTVLRRNSPNAPSSSGTGANIGTGYAAQPASPGLDRHAQQAYYAPRVSPNPQPGTFNNNNNDDFES